VTTHLSDLAAVDLADPLTFSRLEMGDVWHRLRAEAPLYRQPERPDCPPFWVLSRYRDVRALYQDDERFVSAPGNMLDSLRKPHGDPASGMMLALTDAPRHQQLRSMLLKPFSRRIREFVVHRLQERVEQLLTDAMREGTFDFARDFAERVSMGTIGDLLGFPVADHARLLDLSRESLSSDEAEQTAEQAWTARNELLLYCSEHAERRRRNPGDDLVSAMAEGAIDGTPMTLDELTLNCYGFILAGDQTSRLAMVGGLLALIHSPAQWTALKSGRVNVSSATDEVMRWTSPVMHVARTARTDVDIDGRLVRAGDIVTGWNASANRDDEVFTDPDTFDLGRTPNPHLAFGYGAHFCFGAYLGRAEIAAVLRALCHTAAHVELRGEPKPLYSSFLQGYSSLPVRLVA
jgi:cytochrome P450